MISRFLTFTFTIIFGSSAYAQDGAIDGQMCSGPALNAIVKTDIRSLKEVKLDANFAKSMQGAEVDIFYDGDQVRIINARFEGQAGRADMNYYLMDRENYLMEYHYLQNSHYYDDPNSVVLTDEKSFYHVCEGQLIVPAFGGIIDQDIYQNMQVVLDVILTEAEGKSN